MKRATQLLASTSTDSVGLALMHDAIALKRDAAIVTVGTYLTPRIVRPHPLVSGGMK